MKKSEFRVERARNGLAVTLDEGEPQPTTAATSIEDENKKNSESSLTEYLARTWFFWAKRLTRTKFWARSSARARYWQSVLGEDAVLLGQEVDQDVLLCQDFDQDVVMGQDFDQDVDMNRTRLRARS